jgi:HK97 family phage major capsid protein
MGEENTPDPIETTVTRVTESLEDRFKKEAEERDAYQASLQNKLDEMEKRLAANAAAHKVEEREKPVSFGRIIHALHNVARGVSSPWERAGADREKEIIEQHYDERTAMAAGQDSLGGFWVPEQYMPEEFIELFRSNLVLERLGARVMNGLTGSPVILPKQTGGATGYWVAENAAITESNLTAGQVNMEPRQLAALVKMSNRLDLLSNPAAEGLIREDIAATLARKLQTAAIGNDTDAGAPVGVSRISGVNSTSTASINVTNALAMEYKLDEDNALRGSIGWLMHPAVWNAIKGRYRTKHNEFFGINTESPANGFPSSYIGYPVATTTDVDRTASSTATVYLANWSELLIGMWGGMSFAVSTEADTAFAANQIWIRAIMETDVAVRHETSFCVNSSVTDGNGL